MLVAVIGVVVAGAFSFIGSRIAFWISFPFLLAACSAMVFLDRVTVIANRNNHFCPGCRYDLTGTLAAHITRCPECGYALPQNDEAVRPIA